MQKPGQARQPGKAPETGLYGSVTWPSLEYGITEAPCKDSGARDLFYGPECDLIFPSMGRDTELHALIRADAGIYGIHPGDSHNYECLGSSGHRV